MKKRLWKNLFILSTGLLMLVFLSSCSSSKHTHSFGKWTITKEATCESEGSRKRVCNCGKIEIDDIAALGHSFTSYTANNDATCTTDGTKTASCNNGCGKNDTVTDVGSALDHSFTSYVSDGNATCTVDGTKTAICDNGCNTTETITDVDSKVGHSFTSYISNNDATCTVNGTKTALCDNGCTTTETITDVGSALDHSFTNYISNGDASCTANGTETATCDNGCGATHTITNMNSAYGHAFTNYISDNNVTCTTDGTQTATCDNGCGLTDTKPLRANGVHADDDKNDFCDTCTQYIQPFYTEGLVFQFSVTAEHYVVSDYQGTNPNVVIPNSYNQYPVGEIGEKAFYNCDFIVSVDIPNNVTKIQDKAFSDCDILETINLPDDVEIGVDVFRGTIHIEIIVRHPLIFVDAKQATCTEAGNIAHYYCTSCNMYYRDSNGTDRIYDVILPKTHNFVGGACSLCGTVQKEVLIVSIDSVAHLGTFPLGTLEGAIGLPSSIRVYTADNKSHTLPIAWDLSAYNKAEAGEYTLTGVIQSGAFFYNNGLSNQVRTSVTISEVMVGTADIVFILDISGSMSEEIANVRNNLQSFAQAIENMGVSARWSVITYSDYTYSSSLREQTQFVMNGATEWYTSASSCKSAIGSISLANGGDYEEAAVDGLLLAHTASTRADARVFYILVTDADYKNNNHYGVSGMNEASNIFVRESINVSVITTTSEMSSYSALKATGGIQANIYGNFVNDLLDGLVPIIYDEVIE